MLTTGVFPSSIPFPLSLSDLPIVFCIIGVYESLRAPHETTGLVEFTLENAYAYTAVLLTLLRTFSPRL